MPTRSAAATKAPDYSIRIAAPRKLFVEVKKSKRERSTGMGDEVLHEQQRLSQAKLFQWLNRELSANDMITVYYSDCHAEHYLGSSVR